MFQWIIPLIFLFVATASYAGSDPTPDPNAAVIYLQTSCVVQGTTLDNCFETMAELADLDASNNGLGWIWQTRHPSDAAPLLVDVGPGEFGPFKCPSGGGHVTLRGSGREQTILAGSPYGAVIINCDDLSFIDIGLRGSAAGVDWQGGGYSSWSDTDVVGTGPGTFVYGWYDNDTVFPQTGASTHFFHGSRIRTTGSGSSTTQGLHTVAASHYFYGGEIEIAISSASSTKDVVNTGGTAGGDIQLYGTTLRARVNSGVNAGGPITGVSGGSSTKAFRLYGGLIDLSAVNSTGNTGVTGLSSNGNGSLVVTRGTDFRLQASGTGQVMRTLAGIGGTIDSPFQWNSGTAPPTITSIHGEDMFIETDCDGTNCTSKTQPHLMIYSTACSAGGPWFDTSRSACRN